jgi:ArsR family transcriptional regulator
VLELVAERFQVLAEPMRLRLLNQLRDGEMTVGALVEATGGRQANVSRHLSALFAQGVVSRRKEGVFAYYRIQDPKIFDLCELVCDSLHARLSARQRALGGG